MGKPIEGVKPCELTLTDVSPAMVLSKCITKSYGPIWFRIDSAKYTEAMNEYMNS